MHATDEPLSTLLNPTRPDGWVASDETYETQPNGISACDSISALVSYSAMFLMNIQPDDRIVQLKGSWGDEAATPYESRIVVAEYEVIGTGRELVDAMDVAKKYRSCCDWDEAVEWTDVEDRPIVRGWALEIWEG